MKYYKFSLDMEKKGDLVCYSCENLGLSQNTFVTGKKYDSIWDDKVSFFYNRSEGINPTDFLANDKGWLIVSERLKTLLEGLNTDVQFLPILVFERQLKGESFRYYIANITRVVDALCLQKSSYFETNLPRLGLVYTVSRYAIYENAVMGSDIFKLSKHQVIPIFVSARFKEKMEESGMTGWKLNEILTV